MAVLVVDLLKALIQFIKKSTGFHHALKILFNIIFSKLKFKHTCFIFLIIGLTDQYQHHNLFLIRFCHMASQLKIKKFVITPLLKLKQTYI